VRRDERPGARQRVGGLAQREPVSREAVQGAPGSS
jgi:hypothetical protein